MSAGRVDLRKLLSELTGYAPLSADASELVRAGQRALAAGNPVAWEQLARVSGLPPESIRACLEAYPGLARFDGLQRLVGLFGLSVQPTGFRVTSDLGTAFTWCAWDTLFIPRVIGRPMGVTSHCPVTGTPVALRVSADGIEAADPEGLLVSFLVSRQPDACGISGCCCPHVHFLAGAAAARQWRSSQPAGIILTLDEAWHLGRLYVSAMLAAPEPAPRGAGP